MSLAASINFFNSSLWSMGVQGGFDLFFSFSFSLPLCLYEPTGVDRLFFCLFVYILMCFMIQSHNLVITADEISRNSQTTWGSPLGAALRSSVFGKKGNLVLRSWLGGCRAGDCL